MATQASAATGVQILIDAVPIVEIRNATDIGILLATVDVTAHDGDGWSTDLPTLKRGKPFTIEANWVPGHASHVAMMNAALNRTSDAWTVIYPTTGGPGWSFQAFVTEFSPNNTPVDGVLPLRVVVSPDGQMTWTPPV